MVRVRVRVEVGDVKGYGDFMDLFVAGMALFCRVMIDNRGSEL